MSDIDKSMDELLGEIFAYGIDWTEHKDKSEHDHEVSTYAGKIKDELKESLKSSLYSLLMDVIGEYEITEENQDTGHDCYESFCDYCDKAVRDELRAEQRQKLEEFRK